MTEPDRNQLWSDFLTAWPPERVRQMTLDEYTNLEKDDAFIYWVEWALDPLGSIRGSPAFKFGIFRRDASETKEGGRGRKYTTDYAWWEKYGNTEKEAFASVRKLLCEVIDAVKEGNLARVEEIDLSPMYKWKVAFLYQNRQAPILFPIFTRDALFHHYREIDPTAKPNATPYHVMYSTLLERHRGLGDVFQIAEVLWKQFTAEPTKESKAWAVPLAWTVDKDALEALCTKQRVEPEDIDSYLENLLSAAEMSEGDRLALLVEGDVRALGTLKSVEPGQVAWDQVPVNFPSPLLVNPTSEVRLLDAAERTEIWSHLPAPAPTAASAPRYWKIAPGWNAVAWPEWKEGGFASIGWPDLGDLTGVTKSQFDERAAKSGYKKGVSQAWSFLSIRAGDRVVANQGMQRVVGIGTVTQGYQFVPGKHIVGDEDFAHRVSVRWDDTSVRDVDQPGWRRTLLELTKAEFDSLLAAPPASATSTDAPPSANPPTGEAKPAPPCEPRNIILYGPPGTGKTYGTRRRALQLILGEKAIEGMRDEKLKGLFDQKVAQGQIEFVTFHQAYGYEEFLEGIRPVLDQAADAGVRYEIHDGVFKRIALRAASEGLRIEATQPEFEELWEIFVRGLAEDESRVAKSQSGKTCQLELSPLGNVRVRACDVDTEGAVTQVAETHQTASKENARLYWKFRSELGPEPEKFTYDKSTALFAREKGGAGGNHYTALWVVYRELYELSRSIGARKADPGERINRVQQALDKPGSTTTFAFSGMTPQYVLIIDEINRGNMSKILGELITLLEPDKRLAARSELKLPLSYTPQHRFAVPPNLHVLGTMNTADRSIALMDVALRRRFTFEELMPDADVIRSALQARVPDKAFIALVVDVFEALNDRIRFLYDRDHQLGHSYFLDVTDAASLRQVFLDRIVPMLQEYFYGAWDKICTVLGCPFDESGQPRRNRKDKDDHLLTGDRKAYANPIVVARTFPEVKTLGFDHDDYEDRVDYHVRGAFTSPDGLSHEDLCRTFLGLLSLEGPAFAERLDALTPKAATPPAPPLEAVS